MKKPIEYIKRKSKSGYGKQLLLKISKDLKLHLGKGYSCSNFTI